jgi:hypothetical protein
MPIPCCSTPIPSRMLPTSIRFGVFLKGKYYSRVALDKLLSDVAAAYAAQPLKELSTALDPAHLGRPLGCVQWILWTFRP